jgi:hypothetical protein
VRKRYALLFQNHIERLNAITAGMAAWIGVNKDILSRDASSAREIAERIRKHQQRFGQILSALQSSLSGVVPKVKQEVGGNVNRFLDPGSGEDHQDHQWLYCRLSLCRTLTRNTTTSPLDFLRPCTAYFRSNSPWTGLSPNTSIRTSFFIASEESRCGMPWISPPLTGA